MSRITSKRQVTIPKQIADEYGLATGDEIDWIAEGDAIRVSVVRDSPGATTREERLACFDRATERIEARLADAQQEEGETRGWAREDLYDRGVPR